MNLPNKLTLLRIIMIPVFVVLLYLDFPFNNLVALAVFILASITDTLDGYIARKYNLITDFGKFMDPIADKLLVTAAMLVFVDWHMMPAWVVIVVVARSLSSPPCGWWRPTTAASLPPAGLVRSRLPAPWSASASCCWVCPSG